MSLKRYYISGLHPHIWEHPEGEMVFFEDYVTLWAENARLKAEVERLTIQVGADAIDREHGMCCDSSSEVTRLKAKVERLRKAGDAMELTLQADFNGCPYEPIIVIQSIHYWRAAKDGKPSA